MQAYTASPACEASKYFTITGKYPSRAASSRATNTLDISELIIPTTKLEDVGDKKDCTEENMTVALKNSSYRTGMVGLCNINTNIFRFLFKISSHDIALTFVGKWHLSSIEGVDHNNNADAVDIVKGCYFDFVVAIYIENRDEASNNFE